MVDADMFDMLERLARIVRGQDTPFGGIQLVITGDFFQVCEKRVHNIGYAPAL